MKIKLLILNNIQCFKDERLDFSEKINLIIGKNNTGKSTVLRSILNFQQGGNQKPEFLIRKFEKQGFVMATIIDSISRPTLKTVASNETEAILFDSRNAGYSWLHFSTEIPDNHEILKFADKLKRDGSLMDFRPYPDSEPDNAFLPFLAKRKTPYNHGLFDEPSARKIDYDFRNLPTKLSRARTNTLASEFEKACNDILNFVPSVLPGQQNMNLAMMGQYVGPDESITLDQMGDGVAQTVGLLVNLFQVKNKIFILEEVENDLHPEALKKLLTLIINSSEYNQFIISTHSNIVIRMLGSQPHSKIFETKSKLVEDSKLNTSLFTSTISSLQNSSEERIRILYDLGYEMIDSHLSDGYLILEESSAEKVIRDFLIPCFASRLNGRLRTVAAKGASDVALRFHQLHSLFLFVDMSEIYKHKAWVRVDGDNPGKDAVAQLAKKYKGTWPAKHFKVFSKTNFEDYYPSKYSKEIKVIQSEPDNKKRGVLKVDLAKKIVSEYQENPSKISKLFKETANEVIKMLKEIEKAL